MKYEQRFKTPPVSDEVKRAVVEYYEWHDKTVKVTSMTLFRYKFLGTWCDELRVHLTEQDGTKMTAIMSYQGYNGKFWMADRQHVTEEEYIDRADEREEIEAYCEEFEEVSIDYCDENDENEDDDDDTY